MTLGERESMILSCLRDTDLFRGLTDESLRRLALACGLKRSEKGTCVFHEGDEAEALYIVMSGLIIEYVTGPNDLEMAVKERRPYDYFGEIGLILAEPQFVTAVSSQETTLVVIPRNEFLSRMKGEPSISLHVMRVLAHRLLISAKQQIANIYLDSQARLAYFLLSLNSESGGASVAPFSQEEVSQRCGLARQTVAKILGEWKTAEWINTSRGRIEILDRESLGRLLDSY